MVEQPVAGFKLQNALRETKILTAKIAEITKMERGGTGLLRGLR
jgi:hypothetical protein